MCMSLEGVVKTISQIWFAQAVVTPTDHVQVMCHPVHHICALADRIMIPTGTHTEILIYR
jgi:hypothetical protein